MNQKYTIRQGDLVFSVTCVGKLFGHGGNADLLAVIWEEKENKRRETMPWPLEGGEEFDPITVTSGWPT